MERELLRQPCLADTSLLRSHLQILHYLGLLQDRHDTRRCLSSLHMLYGIFRPAGYYGVWCIYKSRNLPSFF